MGIPKDLLKEKYELSRWCILLAYRGSIAHGMYVPNTDPDSVDDKDAIAVCIPPVEFYFGLKQYGSRGTQEIKRGEWDIVAYEVRKFVTLLVKGNPNVLSTLWLDRSDYMKMTDEGKMIVEGRDLFVTRQVYHSFVGYAHSQLHRMTHMAYEGYMGEKRKKLVDKYGYDTKNASHLIRLLRMAVEFLVEGRLIVKRPDRQELLDIKRGKWTLNKVEQCADDLLKQARQAYIDSKLPNDVDRAKIDKLCVDVLSSRLKVKSK